MNYLPSDQPLLVIIGPSGAGKSTVVAELVAQGIVAVTPSWTTRPLRSDETADHFEHHFCDDSEFDTAEKDGTFLEVAQLFNAPYRYGLPRVQQSLNGIVPLIMLRAMVLDKLTAHYANPVIYQIETSRDVIATRLQARSKTDDYNDERLRIYDAEVQAGRSMAQRVFTCSDKTELLKQILAAIKLDFIV